MAAGTEIFSPDLMFVALLGSRGKPFAFPPRLWIRRSGPLEISNDVAARSQALEKAVADARQKAAAIARALGRPVGEVLSAQESGASYPEPIYFHAVKDGMGSAAQAPTPVEPGQLTLTASVQVVFALGK